jgi:orotate phosphoribosyltransferase
MPVTTESTVAFNNEFRTWVKNWSGGLSIATVAKSAQMSKSKYYAATQGTALLPRNVLIDVIRALCPTTLDTEDGAAWVLKQTRIWESKWEVVEASTRSDLGRGGAEPMQLLPEAKVASAPPLGADAVSQLDATHALPVLAQITEESIRTIAAAHVYIAKEKTPVGYHEKLPVGVYVDLHSAACNPVYRDQLATFLALRVKSTLHDSADSLVIATPREGNVLVGSRVADLCGLPFLMVRTKKAPRFGFPVEGAYRSGSEAIIVDDLVMGSMTSRTAKLLRKHGLRVQRCFSIFERVDADPRSFLTAERVELDAAFGIDDELLSSLRASTNWAS